MDKFDILYSVGEGYHLSRTYGKVLKAIHKDTRQIVAIKKIKHIDEHIQIKRIAIREIRILKSLNHPNIVNLLEVIQKKNQIFLIFEFVDTTIIELINHQPQGMNPCNIKKILYQALNALTYMHNNKIIHRDIKPENLLVSSKGIVKICDFGFARYKTGDDNLTHYVSTRWYRAPELLVYAKYTEKVDIWAIGCMAGEMMLGYPLFPGQSDYDTLCMIVRMCGNLTEWQYKAFSEQRMFDDLKVLE